MAVSHFSSLEQKNARPEMGRAFDSRFHPNYAATRNSLGRHQLVCDNGASVAHYFMPGAIVRANFLAILTGGIHLAAAEQDLHPMVPSR